ncbi:uncharacterized protein LOC116618677 [Nematostella vectensis]|uniref:uncharacterized protein LOC116618677 n=1 Tax=Nematostella vectensis TaxID=45351 RepID=UPI00138FEC57|nr:uncharacterized protein LOC116618677 [Nematostella vectensis]
MAELDLSTPSQCSSDIVDFLEDVLETAELLREKIAVLVARYPVTAKDNSIPVIIGEIQMKIKGRLELERKLLKTPTPSPSPPVSPDTVEATPVKEVLYLVSLFESSCLRRRTIDQIGKLESVLPRKKTVKVAVSVECLTNEKYDAGKRLLRLKDNQKQYESLDIQNQSRPYDIFVVDIGKLNLNNESIPFFNLRGFESGKSLERFAMNPRASRRLKNEDATERFATAIKISAANYAHWSAMYYKSVANKDNNSLQRHLRQYVKDPLHSKGVIYCCQVRTSDEKGDPSAQMLIGKAQGSFIEDIKSILAQTSTEKASLFQLTLSNQMTWSNLTENGSETGSSRQSSAATTADSNAQVIGLILDFGYPECLVEELKGSLDMGDRLSTLEKKYIKYFGAKSPLGLNNGLDD